MLAVCVILELDEPLAETTADNVDELVADTMAVAHADEEREDEGDDEREDKTVALPEIELKPENVE